MSMVATCAREALRGVQVFRIVQIDGQTAALRFLVLIRNGALGGIVRIDRNVVWSS
ncbi:MAG: hypothetical protein IKN81_08815 [Oscillospiraceae bacterium]|nr:hypothetical protein [Oscillospiraceae bacterium]